MILCQEIPAKAKRGVQKGNSFSGNRNQHLRWRSCLRNVPRTGLSKQLGLHFRDPIPGVYNLRLVPNCRGLKLQLAREKNFSAFLRTANYSVHDKYILVASRNRSCFCFWPYVNNIKPPQTYPVRVLVYTPMSPARRC